MTLMMRCSKRAVGTDNEMLTLCIASSLPHMMTCTPYVSDYQVQTSAHTHILV